METADSIKTAVQRKYEQIARAAVQGGEDVSSCCSSKNNHQQGCGCGCGGGADLVDMSATYSEEDRSAVPDGADLALGCGTPAAFADIEEGMTVLDLGSGAGIDCFVASRYAGPTGKVIGVDMTEAMVMRANENRLKVGAGNVEFRLGEIEELPVESNSIDRILSNCVINLVPDKERAFREIRRVLKVGGKFTISDIVVDGAISDEERHDASLWAGCISGALKRSEYLGIIQKLGFRNIAILSERPYGHTLKSGAKIFSITITGTR